MNTIATDVLTENVQDLLDFGEDPQRIAKRVGVEYRTLLSRLHRAGRPDLAARLAAISIRQAEALRAYWDPNKAVTS